MIASGAESPALIADAKERRIFTVTTAEKKQDLYTSWTMKNCAQNAYSIHLVSWREPKNE